MSNIFSNEGLKISNKAFKVIDIKTILFTIIGLLIIFPTIYLLKYKIEFLENNLYKLLPIILTIVIFCSFISRNYYKIYYKNYTYYLNEDGILLCSGLLSKEKIFIPYYVIQNVNISTGPILRKYGLAHLNINTLSEDVSIMYLDNSIVEKLKVQINEKNYFRLMP